MWYLWKYVKALPPCRCGRKSTDVRVGQVWLVFELHLLWAVYREQLTWQLWFALSSLGAWEVWRDNMKFADYLVNSCPLPLTPSSETSILSSSSKIATSQPERIWDQGGNESPTWESLFLKPVRLAWDLSSLCKSKTSEVSWDHGSSFYSWLDDTKRNVRLISITYNMN